MVHHGCKGKHGCIGQWHTRESRYSKGQVSGNFAPQISLPKNQRYHDVLGYTLSPKVTMIPGHSYPTTNCNSSYSLVGREYPTWYTSSGFLLLQLYKTDKWSWQSKLWHCDVPCAYLVCFSSPFRGGKTNQYQQQSCPENQLFTSQQGCLIVNQRRQCMSHEECVDQPSEIVPFCAVEPITHKSRLVS